MVRRSLFRVGFFAIARQLSRESELLVLNAQGLRSAQWSEQTIPWVEIEEVSLGPIREAQAPSFISVIQVFFRGEVYVDGLRV